MDNNMDYINLIISPHLDDAVISLGGLLTKESQKTKIITVFAGIPERPLTRVWDLNCGFRNSTKAMEGRITENKLALASLGIEEKNIINLPFLDIQYRKSFFVIPKYFGKKEITDEIIEPIIEELKKLIDKENSKIIKIFVPIAFDEGDHGIARDAGIETYKNIIDLNKKIQLYFYQDMPYFYTLYLRRTKRESGKSKEQVLMEIKPREISCENKVIELTGEEYSKKVEAIKLYKSQFDMIIPDPDHVLLIHRPELLSKLQAVIYKIKSPHCEVVYKVI
jgi:LmbE family N-acetylglucosaminyl deacetylase